MNKTSLEELSEEWLEKWIKKAVKKYKNSQNDFLEKIETITKRAFFR